MLRWTDWSKLLCIDQPKCSGAGTLLCNGILANIVYHRFDGSDDYVSIDFAVRGYNIFCRVAKPFEDYVRHYDHFVKCQCTDTKLDVTGGALHDDDQVRYRWCY